jgi:RluA family pseudouridine synthase
VTLRLLLETAEMIAVDKPPGLAVIPGRGEGPCVRSIIEQQLKRTVWVVHRLDRDTSGVLLFALTTEKHRELSMAFEHEQVSKRYVALVEGVVDKPLDLDWPLAPARRSRMRVSAQGKPSRTLVRPLQALKNATLVEAEPLTGRTHQIRVHLAHAGHPLITDHQYRHGEQSSLIARTPLHAARVEWGGLVIESPMPKDMRDAITALQ